MTEPPRRPGQPYCSNCGYDLEGATESARCPECGKPLVEVLRRAGAPWLQAGRRYRSPVTIFGMPAIHIAFGPGEDEPRGRARGFIAIGDDAMGIVAIGGVARGVVAIGGLALGGFSLGGMSIGVITAFGGGAIAGLLAVGGGALGGIAKGGGAAGIIADGGSALGVWARGGGAFGIHRLGQNPGANSPEAAAMFDQLSWLLGATMTPGGLARPAAIVLLLTLFIGGVLALIGWMAHQRRTEEPPR